MGLRGYPLTQCPNYEISLGKCPLREIYDIRSYLGFQFMCFYANYGFLCFGITMTNESLDQRIAKQEERLKQLKAQKQAVDAREKKKITEQQRKDDTRRKILLGSYLLKKMENEANKEKILDEMNEYLTEDRDRKLFNL